MVRYGDEYYFFIGWACTNLTRRWWALSAWYFLLLSCWPWQRNAKDLNLVIGTRTVTVQESVLPEHYGAKENKEYILFTKNQWKFPEWARERATREYLGGSIQQDGYWSKDPDERPGPYLRGPTDDVTPRHSGGHGTCRKFSDVVYVTVPATVICIRKQRYRSHAP